MPETCEKSLSLVNRCVYYARQIREIRQILPYSAESFEALSFEIHS